MYQPKYQAGPFKAIKESLNKTIKVERLQPKSPFLRQVEVLQSDKPVVQKSLARS